MKHPDSAPVFSLTGHIVDIPSHRIYDGEIRIKEGHIEYITPRTDVPATAPYFLPGLTDAHIHIESSMMIPEQFAKVAVRHGVVCAVCDPHEITNVLGAEGIDFMVNNARNSRFNFWFGLPSCVPSSHLETAGAVIDARQTQELIRRGDLHFLAEMMNFPGILTGDTEVSAKIRAAREAGKVIDGHAPGVRGEDLKRYIAAGISTDHECATLDEAREKVVAGMEVIIREGSAARNFEALCPLIDETPDHVMLCSDDKHPDDLLQGHIDTLVRRGLNKGLSIWNLLQAACLNPVRHYGIMSGMMGKGDPATFIAVNNLNDFEVVATYIDGHRVYDKNNGLNDNELTRTVTPLTTPNNFNARPITEAEIATTITKGNVKVITALDGELHTPCEIIPAEQLNDASIQKIMVYNRYGNGHPQVAFIRGFGLRSGAIGATIAHDSHNIVVIGTSDEEMVTMANALIESKGGLGMTREGHTEILPLPIAGLMSAEPAEVIAEKYHTLLRHTEELGCTLKAPFITMAFMALPVIPELKLTDRGLVDVAKFDFTELVTR